MCGRFTLTELPLDFLRQLGVAGWPPPAAGQAPGQAREPALAGRYNIAPTQQVLVVRRDPQGGGRELRPMTWGLVPSWATDAHLGARLINARAETLADKPAFRAAFRRRRCLILADSFYEWAGTGKRRRPLRIVAADGRPFCFAGLWEHWQGAAAALTSCTIVTTAANELLAPFHARMPVILAPEHWAAWLGDELPGTGAPAPARRADAAAAEAREAGRPGESWEPTRARLASLLVACPAERLRLYPVEQAVNNVRNEGPALVRPVQADLLFAGRPGEAEGRT